MSRLDKAGLSAVKSLEVAREVHPKCVRKEMMSDFDSWWLIVDESQTHSVASWKAMS